jgi:hypothetical protein
MDRTVGTAPKETRSVRPVLAVAGALLAGWLIVICVGIANEEAPGEESPQQLLEATHAALAARDAGALQDLFTGGSAGKDYAERYLERVKDLPPQDVHVRLDDGVLLVTGAGVCTPWPLAEEDGKWLLEAVPPAGAPQCPAETD